MEAKFIEIILFMPGFLFSLSCHEAAHAYAAYKLGDPTAKNLGRVSLSPVPHTDVLGTLILPILGLISGFLFGWGKPVPVDYRNLKNPKRDGLWIAAAGPSANLLLALVFALAVHLYLGFADGLVNVGLTVSAATLFAKALVNYVYLNLALCFFNLIPVQPLDGSKILFGVLPWSVAQTVDSFSQRYGMVILLLLIFTGALRFIVWPPIAYLGQLLLSL